MRRRPGDAGPSLSRGAVERGLATRLLGRPLEVRDAVPSTNDVVREAGRLGAPEGLTLIADAQTAGRGRLGRAWASPPGVNLYCSVLLRPEMPARFAPQLTLLAGLAVGAATLAEGALPTLKWPNDLLLDDRKAGGVLAELEVGPDGGVDFVVLGIGLNLNVSPDALPPDVAPLATSFAAALGRPIDRAAFARRLLEALDAWFARFRRDGFGPIREGWTRLSALAGRRLSVAVTAAGGERQVIAGVARGLGEDGALLLDTPTGPRAVLSGQVTVLEGGGG